VGRDHDVFDQQHDALTVNVLDISVAKTRPI